ncbi:unnamed protein product [Effrenium voratum]|nr:unnamed protein product [Effrenium voratum]
MHRIEARRRRGTAPTRCAAASVGQIANVLFPAGFTCGGSKAAIDKLCELATKARALQARPIKTGGAFHTPLMEPAKKELTGADGTSRATLGTHGLPVREELEQAIDAAFPKMKPPRCAVYFNITGKKVPAGSKPAEFVDYMKRQMTSEVLWEQTVRHMVFDGVRRQVVEWSLGRGHWLVKDFFEVGPHKQLKAMIKRLRSVTDAVMAGSGGFDTWRPTCNARTVRSFPWLFSKSSEQERWWRHHPRPGDLLIGWVMHPKLTQGNKTDLEAEFSSGCGGLWRSRGLAFRGKFSSTVQDGQLTLQDEATTLKGRMREASLSIQGSVIHEGSPGGEFILRPLPECYREWWSQVKGKLEDPNPGFLVLNEDGSFEGGDASDEDASSFPDITSPAELRKFLLLRRITQQVGSQRRPSPRRSKRQELLFKFALRPDEVKEYLDRYVICQTAAKEMLAVAICDHYNRAKEELLSSSPESESSESAVAVDSKADESKDPSEAVPEPAAEERAERALRRWTKLSSRTRTTTTSFSYSWTATVCGSS